MSDARRRILERRARFLAAALASSSLGCERCNPLVCLEPAPTPGAHDAAADGSIADTAVGDAAPEAESDASADTADASTDARADAPKGATIQKAVPHPCLSKPLACLTEKFE